jgi:hypothetical protein
MEGLRFLAQPKFKKKKKAGIKEKSRNDECSIVHKVS